MIPLWLTDVIAIGCVVLVLIAVAAVVFGCVAWYRDLAEERLRNAERRDWDAGRRAL